MPKIKRKELVKKNSTLIKRIAELEAENEFLRWLITDGAYEVLAERGKEMNTMASEEAFEELIRGIKRSNEFRTRVINGLYGIKADYTSEDIIEIYRKFACALGKSLTELSKFEKQQAFVCAVMKDTEARIKGSDDA